MAKDSKTKPEMTELEKAELKEYRRLRKIYKGLPENKLAVIDGLIRQAARLRARADALWNDIRENGETEMFSQSKDAEPYERERPASRTFTATDKAYQSIIKQLNDLCPEAPAKDRLSSFMDRDE